MSSTGGFILGSLVTIGFQYLWVKYVKPKITRTIFGDQLSESRGRRIFDDKNRSKEGYGSIADTTTADNNVTTSDSRSVYDVVSGVSQSGFLTELVGQLWPYINTMGCQIVKDSVEPTFATDLPGPLATLRFSKLDLGPVPLRLDNIVVHEVDRTNHQLQLELDIMWDGQCDIELKADYIGRLGVKHVKLAGRMSILLKPLIGSGSIVQAATYSFVNAPSISLDFTGLAQIADVTLIDSTVRMCIQNVLKGILVLPERMTTRLDNTPPFYDIYQLPLGIIRITILSGSGFQIQKGNLLSKDDIPDVWCSMKLGNKSWKTSVCKDNVNPVWNETYDLVLYNHDQILSIIVYDKDEGKLGSTDDLLGNCQLTVGELLLSANRIRDIELLDEDEQGTNSYIRVCADLCSFTNSSLDTINEQKKILKTKDGDIKKDALIYGVVCIVLSRVCNIPVTNEKESNCYIKVDYGTNAKIENGTSYQTPTVIGSVNPMIDVAYNILLTEEIKPSDVSISLYNDYKNPTDNKKKTTEATLLGSITILHQQLLDATNHTITETRAIGTEGATLEFKLTLYGLQLPSEPAKEKTLLQKDGELYTTSSGSTTGGSNNNISITLCIKSGRGFSSQRQRLANKIFKPDIPDCYVKTRVGPIPQIWRTKTIPNRYDPIWNEQKDYNNVHYGMIITCDVYDEDSGKMDRDDHIGILRVSIGKLLLAGGPMEMELVDRSGNGMGTYLTVECMKKETTAQDIVEQNDNILDGSTRASNRTIQKPIPIHPPFQVLSHNADQTTEELVSVRIVVADGRGFQVEKRKLRKDDVPDCYCYVKIKEDPASQHQIWKTSVIENNIQPVWNEAQDFYYVRHDMILNVDVYDYDKGAKDDDDFLGNGQIAINELLMKPNERVEIPLRINDSPTGSYITLTGELIIPPEIKISSWSSSVQTSDLIPAIESTKPVTTDQITSTIPREVVSSQSEPPLDALTPSAVAAMNGLVNLYAVRIKITSGRGFQIEKKKLRKNDIPDCYCNVKVSPSDYVWRTSTIKNNVSPSWNESKMYRYVQGETIIDIDVYDEDSGTNDKDDFLGRTKVPMGRLMDRLGGAVEVALFDAHGNLNGCFVTLMAEEMEMMNNNIPKLVTEEIEKKEMTAPAMATATGIAMATAPAMAKATAPAMATATAPAMATAPASATATAPASATTQPSTTTTTSTIAISETMKSAIDSIKSYKDFDLVSILCHVISGRKFPIEKKKFRKDDIPDCYCKINLRSNKSDVWKTSTIQNNCNPVWSNERKEYHNIQVNDTFHIEVWDEDSGPRDPDDFLGEVNITVRNILELNNMVTELSLCTEGKQNGSYISLQFEILSV